MFFWSAGAGVWSLELELEQLELVQLDGMAAAVVATLGSCVKCRRGLCGGFLLLSSSWRLAHVFLCSCTGCKCLACLGVVAIYLSISWCTTVGVYHPADVAPSGSAGAVMHVSAVAGLLSMCCIVRSAVVLACMCVSISCAFRVAPCSLYAMCMFMFTHLCA